MDYRCARSSFCGDHPLNHSTLHNSFDLSNAFFEETAGEFNRHHSDFVRRCKNAANSSAFKPVEREDEAGVVVTEGSSGEEGGIIAASS